MKSVSLADLEDIRRAVLDNLSLEDDAPHRCLMRELQFAIPVLGPDDSRLGPWVLTERRGQLALVRIPPREAMNYLFVAALAREKGGWIVTDFFEERMQAR